MPGKPRTPIFSFVFCSLCAVKAAQPATIEQLPAAQTAEFRLALGIYQGGVEAMGKLMRDTITFAVLLLLVLFLGAAAPAAPQPDEKRIALVVGNGDYQAGKRQTPANDAGLIAQTLQAAGFDVVGARDLDQESLRRSFKDFLEKASSSGPNTIAFIYLSGYGLQLEGENYFAPIDARIERDLDVPTQAVRLSDYTRPLNTLNLKATILVLDAARQSPSPSRARRSPAAWPWSIHSPMRWSPSRPRRGRSRPRRSRVPTEPMLRR